MAIQQFRFSREGWNRNDLIQAYSFRFTETPDPVQHDDCIGSGVNPAHREGYDNVSLLTLSPCKAGVKASMHCSFEGAGCPEIILVEKPESCDDGAVRYGACFEIVLYKNGINVWRHYREDGHCFWHKRLGVEFPVSENEIHQLDVHVEEKMLHISVDGRNIHLRTEDLPQQFHVGLTLCEGIARACDLRIEE